MPLQRVLQRRIVRPILHIFWHRRQPPRVQRPVVQRPIRKRRRHRKGLFPRRCRGRHRHILERSLVCLCASPRLLREERPRRRSNPSPRRNPSTSAPPQASSRDGHRRGRRRRGRRAAPETREHARAGTRHEISHRTAVYVWQTPRQIRPLDFQCRVVCMHPKDGR